MFGKKGEWCMIGMYDRDEGRNELIIEKQSLSNDGEVGNSEPNGCFTVLSCGP